MKSRYPVKEYAKSMNFVPTTATLKTAADYASLIQRRYPAAFAYRNDPEKFAEAVARLGYVTDPHYAKKLRTIIHSHIKPLLGK
jgi:hypothetical protein